MKKNKNGAKIASFCVLMVLGDFLPAKGVLFVTPPLNQSL